MTLKLLFTNFELQICTRDNYINKKFLLLNLLAPTRYYNNS